MTMTYEPLCRIDIYSHFFTVTKARGRVPGILYKLAHRFTQIKFVPKKNNRYQSNNQKDEPEDKTFAAVTKDQREHRFHNGQYDMLLQLFEAEFVEPHLYEVHRHELYSPDKIEVGNRFTLRDYQIPASEFILAPDQEHDLHTRFIAAVTGSGKTAMSLISIADKRCRTRTMITMLPKFIKKWPNDVQEITTAEKKDITVIQGSSELKTIIAMAKEEHDLPKFILISLTTLAIFYKTYLLNPEIATESYGCHPQDLPKLLKVGQIILDEAHESFHYVYLLTIFNHVPKIIGLSGTLVSRDPFILKIQKLIFPHEIRFDEIKPKQYIKSYAMSYTFDDMRKANIRTTARGSPMYSQIAFEESILKNRDALANYLKMIGYVVQNGYIRDHIKDDKFAVFAARKDMCTIIHQYLKKQFPQYDVRRYIDVDPYDNLLLADIRVTTLQSGGTAHDIPNLRGVFMTNNVDSITAVLQCIGRLRELKDRDVKFFWAYCEQIAKHVQYHKSRLELIRDRVLFTKELRMPFEI